MIVLKNCVGMISMDEYKIDFVIDQKKYEVDYNIGEDYVVQGIGGFDEEEFD